MRSSEPLWFGFERGLTSPLHEPLNNSLEWVPPTPGEPLRDMRVCKRTPKLGLKQQFIASHPPSNWSTKDVIAHLRAWQQVSFARLEAAQFNQEPEFPGWLAGLDPESEDYREEFNLQIFESNRGQTWLNVHKSWREGFLRFLELGEAIPDDALIDAERYPWLKGSALSAVLLGSYDHHREHLEETVNYSAND